MFLRETHWYQDIAGPTTAANRISHERPQFAQRASAMDGTSMGDKGGNTAHLAWKTLMMVVLIGKPRPSMIQSVPCIHNHVLSDHPG